MMAPVRFGDEQYRLLFDASPDGILVADIVTRRLMLANPAMCRMLGYSRDELVAMRVDDLHTPESMARVQAGFAAHAAGETSVIVDVPFRGKDGRVIYVDVSATPMVVDGTACLVGFFRDATERRNADTEFRKLALAVEQSPESVVITDRDGRIEYVNDAFVATTGYAREDVLGKNPRILNSGETPKETYAALWATLSRGEVWKGQFENRRKDGGGYTEFAIITPLRQADGHISHYVAVTEDITEKKRLGRELDRHRHHLEELVATRTRELVEAKKAAEAANQAKSAFLANMSHEIRTPMNAILGLTHLLRRDGPTPRQVKHLDKIGGAGKHLLEIIDHILDLSKIEAGKLELETSDFHLSSLMDYTHLLIAESARAKGLAVAVDADEVPIWLHGDLARLRQALLNYAGNAVKFTEHGRIVLRARKLAENGDELMLRFEVQDTGIGVADDEMPRLFQAFGQLDASTTRKHGGAGLGLSVTRHLARMMGGDAGAESTLGKGSLFWFTARLRRGRGVMSSTTARVDDAEATLRARHAGQRVLIVEDNVINREVMLELLHGVALSADVAVTGVEAVAKARAGDYDLILMDVQMPEMDGIEATRAILALPGYEHVPILAMTANAYEEDRRACAAAGMRDFVAKPTKPETLYAALLNWLPMGAARRAVAADLGPAPANGGDAVAASASLQPLRKVPGLDVSRGLASLGGRVEKYVGLLRQFIYLRRADMARMQRHLDAGERESARVVVHTVKGVAGSLGAIDIARVATDLDDLLRKPAGSDEEGRIEVLKTAFDDALADLTVALLSMPVAPEDSTSAAAATTEQTHEFVARMKSLLASNDTAAQTLADENVGLLRDILGSRHADFMHCLANFDFACASSLLATSDDETTDGPAK